MTGESGRNIRLSVRSLVELVLRSGDLDNRRSFAAEKDAMQAGSRLHRKIQKRMGSNYKPEVTFRHTVEEEGFTLQIEGRADGVIESASGVTIDEIKCVYMNLSYIHEPAAVHMAQAMCYAYFCCYDKNLTAASIQMTYCNLETEEIKRFTIEKSYDELKEWFGGLVHEYIKWARYTYHHGLRRDESLRTLEFPYAYREGQRELAVSVYRAISRGCNLFIQAPTGTGKTLSTVFPALKAMGEGHSDKIFYLTAKTVTRAVAEEAYNILRESGLYFTSVTITAKEKLCILEKPDCNPEACERAKGHFDRVNDAVYDVIQSENSITREVILKYAEKYNVCPFEMCLDITNWSDGIICDYNYVFDTNVRLKRYFADNISEDYIFLVDEAHNLVGRAREMYSAVLVKEDFLTAKKILKKYSDRLVQMLERCNRELLEMKRECDGYNILPDIRFFVNSLMTLFGELEKFMNEHPEFDDRTVILDFYFALREFLYVYDRTDDAYKIYTELLADGKFIIKLFCINPASNLKECLDKGKSTIFFSATLLPVIYYKELLSGNTEDYAVYTESPFKRSNRTIIVSSDMSSLYTRRCLREYDKLIYYIKSIVEEKCGNYIVFFPSYAYMDVVKRRIAETLPELDKLCIMQTANMSEIRREEFLEEFNKKRTAPLIAMCVMGGIFSEGIDLKEERLIGVIVVGTGLPMVCTEQKILKDYFDEKGKNGFDFSYRYPGMNKVMQAAGRVIRTACDKGVIALLDERFLSSEYQGIMPREWSDYKCVTSESVRSTVKDFWDRHKL